MKTATAPQIVRRESHTEQLFFTTRPDFATRQALKAAGYRWNRVFWWRNINSTSVVKPKDLGFYLTPIGQGEESEQPAEATA